MLCAHRHTGCTSHGPTQITHARMHECGHMSAYHANRATAFTLGFDIGAWEPLQTIQHGNIAAAVVVIVVAATAVPGATLAPDYHSGTAKLIHSTLAARNSVSTCITGRGGRPGIAGRRLCALGSAHERWGRAKEHGHFAISRGH